MRDHSATTRDESKENPMRRPPSTHRKHGFRKLAAGLLTVLVSSLATGADDTALFSTSFPPNVLLMVDNSGSMNEIMTPPGVRRQLHAHLQRRADQRQRKHHRPGRRSRSATAAGTTAASSSRPATSATRSLTPTTADHASSFYITRTFCGETRRLYFDGSMSGPVGNNGPAG